MLNQLMEQNKKRGFTLGEMVITVAIVGSITAIAVPNYMRVRMQVNMEMVKQHLKTIGTHMNDLYNQNRQFPQNINQLGNSGEEVAITSSLFGIDQRGYTTDGYTTGPNFTTYQLRTCPKAGQWGIAGDRCFVLTPLGITEDPAGGSASALNPWDGSNIPMIAEYVVMTEGFISKLFADPTVSEQRKISILADMLEFWAYMSVLETQSLKNYSYKPYGAPPDWKTRLVSSFMTINSADIAKFNSYLPKIEAAFQAKGFQLYIADRSKNGSYAELSGKSNMNALKMRYGYYGSSETGEWNTSEVVWIEVAAKANKPMTASELGQLGEQLNKMSPLLPQTYSSSVTYNNNLKRKYGS